MNLLKVGACCLLAGSIYACTGDTEGQILTPDPVAGFRYVNHHAYRAVINPIEAPLPNRGCLTGVLISDYRDRWLRTEYRVCRESDTRFTVERNDPDAP